MRCPAALGTTVVIGVVSMLFHHDRTAEAKHVTEIRRAEMKKAVELHLTTDDPLGEPLMWLTPEEILQFAVRGYRLRRTDFEGGAVIFLRQV